MAVRDRVSGRGPRRRNGVPGNLRLLGCRRRGKDSPEGAYRSAGPWTKDEKARGCSKAPGRRSETVRGKKSGMPPGADCGQKIHKPAAVQGRAANQFASPGTPQRPAAGGRIFRRRGQKIAESCPDYPASEFRFQTCMRGYFSKRTRWMLRGARLSPGATSQSGAQTPACL